MSGEARALIVHEFQRKAFHLLTLVYLALFVHLGRGPFVRLIACWAVVVASFEAARLRLPALNRFLTGPFRGIIRPDEDRRMSGVHYTTLGALLSTVLFGVHPKAVHAALLCLAFGDAAAALAGRLWGRRLWPGSRKSVVGSAACAVVCFGAMLAAGIPWPAGLVAGLAVAALELAPMPFDDNLWIPLAAGGVVWLTSI